MHASNAITLESATQVVHDTLARARETYGDKVAIACAVVDPTGDLVAFAAHESCGSLPRKLAVRKAYSSALLGRTTAEVAEGIAAGRIDLDRLNDDQLVAIPGAALLNSDGEKSGAVGVSGLPPHDDQELATLTAHKHGGR